ncbi:MAG: hypothetical protein ACYDDB_03450 [bacterium]
MPIKKSKDEWASESAKSVQEDPAAKLKNNDPEPPKKSRRQEAKIPFAVRIPESLYNDLKDYIERYGKAGESMNEIIMAGTESELQKRLSKAGESLDSKIKINNIISGIQSFLKELEEFK